MTNDENVKIVEERPTSGGHTGMFAFLIVGLGVALVADGVLLVRSNHIREDMASNQDGTQQQITKLGDATTSLLEQRLKTLDEEILTQSKEAQTSAANAVRQARAQTQKTGDELSAKIQQQQQEQQQVTSQIADLKSATSEADNKIAAVSTDVDGVKTDVTGVKSDVASTKDGLDKTSADLKRAMGDMGVMSGLIATNGKDLQALRELGDRNYIEFDLNKMQSQKKIGDVIVSLKKSDPKHNRFTVTVSADDKLVEKRDRTINEPVQLYVHNSRQPYEIVVNEVKKDEIVGYLSTPKVTLARQ
jgi:chromosome segregation ATPase